MKAHTPPLLLIIILAGVLASCTQPASKEKDASADPEIVIKYRDDGTRSSASQINEFMQVHGTRVTYFRDGETVSSKLSFRNGLKHGPSVKYYKNGQEFEYSSYVDGERHGPHRKYYKSGELLAEYDYENGHALPGLKEYEPDGTLVSGYPEIGFSVIDHLASRSRIDLEISCTWKKGKMKYFILKEVNGKTERTYLITENGTATMQYFIPPGETLSKKVDILAEIPTDLGNILVLERSYQLRATNVK